MEVSTVLYLQILRFYLGRQKLDAVITYLMQYGRCHTSVEDHFVFQLNLAQTYCFCSVLPRNCFLLLLFYHNVNRVQSDIIKRLSTYLQYKVISEKSK